MSQVFRRKLQALDFHNPNGFNVNDETQYRNLMVWLEDQKIRHYKIEERAGLRNVCGGEWNTYLLEYLSDLGYAGPQDKKSIIADWILGYAVRLEYGDNTDKFRLATSAASKPVNAQSTNPLDNLDFDEPDVKAGVASLATLLQIPPHADHTLVLKAVCLLVQERLARDVVERVQKEGVKPATQIPMDKVELGFETGDYISSEAAKILRLLHIRELRELQDSVNEAIVKVQELTANPKTDTRLGKVGR